MAKTSADTHAYTEAHVEVDHGAHEEHHGEFNPLSIDWGMFTFFLIVFALASMILKKFAWKPILDGLDQREKEIHDALENAERLKHELSSLDAKCKEAVAAADQQSKEIVAQARKGASEAARVIEKEAREEALILMENAKREIGAAEEKAKANLRVESANVAVLLASKIIGAELDEAKNKALTDRLIKEL